MSSPNVFMMPRDERWDRMAAQLQQQLQMLLQARQMQSNQRAQNLQTVQGAPPENRGATIEALKQDRANRRLFRDPAYEPGLREASKITTPEQAQIGLAGRTVPSADWQAIESLAQRVESYSDPGQRQAAFDVAMAEPRYASWANDTKFRERFAPLLRLGEKATMELDDARRASSAGRMAVPATLQQYFYKPSETPGLPPAPVSFTEAQDVLNASGGDLSKAAIMLEGRGYTRQDTAKVQADWREAGAADALANGLGGTAAPARIAPSVPPGTPGTGQSSDLYGLAAGTFPETTADILRARHQVENGGQWTNPTSVAQFAGSRGGARGPMQVMPETALGLFNDREIGPRLAQAGATFEGYMSGDPQTAVLLSAAHDADVARTLRTNGVEPTPELLHVAYNTGAQRALDYARGNQDALLPETRAYLTRLGPQSSEPYVAPRAPMTPADYEQRGRDVTLREKGYAQTPKTREQTQIYTSPADEKQGYDQASARTAAYDRAIASVAQAVRLQKVASTGDLASLSPEQGAEVAAAAGLPGYRDPNDLLRLDSRQLQDALLTVRNNAAAEADALRGKLKLPGKPFGAIDQRAFLPTQYPSPDVAMLQDELAQFDTYRKKNNLPPAEMRRVLAGAATRTPEVAEMMTAAGVAPEDFYDMPVKQRRELIASVSDPNTASTLQLLSDLDMQLDMEEADAPIAEDTVRTVLEQVGASLDEPTNAIFAKIDASRVDLVRAAKVKAMVTKLKNAPKPPSKDVAPSADQQPGDAWRRVMDEELKRKRAAGTSTY